ncbi:hypothetical protein BB560_002758 [Smittium megazygosporum]|uniref:Uncharacterized protein n=1 Tax=Smittium megazygosporum TaxID=133381 RepID=A0A2T9ZE10_9FUNG|nr:hypothetical protein BB560_002758 [Smittium megazygosporum]
MSRILVLSGLPGSGKSTFAQSLTFSFQEWIHLDLNDIGSKEACIRSCTKLIKSNKNIIIDGLNYDHKERRAWVEFARDSGITIDSLFFDLCKTRVFNRTGHISGVQGKFGAEVVSRVEKQFIPPSPSEGFRVCLSISSFIEIITIEISDPGAAYSTSVIHSILTSISYESTKVSGSVSKTKHVTIIDDKKTEETHRPRPSSRCSNSSSDKVNVSVNVNLMDSESHFHGNTLRCSTPTALNRHSSCDSEVSTHRTSSTRRLDNNCHQNHNQCHCHSPHNHDSHNSYNCHKCSSDHRLSGHYINDSVISQNRYDELNYGVLDINSSRDHRHFHTSDASLVGGSGRCEESRRTQTDENDTTSHNHEVIRERSEMRNRKYGPEYRKYAHRAQKNFTENERSRFNSNSIETEDEYAIAGVKHSSSNNKVKFRANERTFNRSEKTADNTAGVYSSVHQKTKVTIEKEDPFSSSSASGFFSGSTTFPFYSNGGRLGSGFDSPFFKKHDFKKEFSFLN